MDVINDAAFTMVIWAQEKQYHISPFKILNKLINSLALRLILFFYHNQSLLKEVDL